MGERSSRPAFPSEVNCFLSLISCYHPYYSWYLMISSSILKSVAPFTLWTTHPSQSTVLLLQVSVFSSDRWQLILVVFYQLLAAVQDQTELAIAQSLWVARLWSSHAPSCLGFDWWALIVIVGIEVHRTEVDFLAFFSGRGLNFEIQPFTSSIFFGTIQL